MTTTHKRSKRQLYIGLAFITLAIVAALFRSFGPSSSSDSEPEFFRVDELIGLSDQEVIERLGEPTARLEFIPGEDPNALRMQMAERLTQDGTDPSGEILELSWFDPEFITTVWFVAESDEAGSAAPPRSVDSVRYARSTQTEPAASSLD